MGAQVLQDRLTACVFLCGLRPMIRWPVHDEFESFRAFDGFMRTPILRAHIQRWLIRHPALRDGLPLGLGFCREEDVVMAKVKAVRLSRQRPDPGRQAALNR